MTDAALGLPLSEADPCGPDLDEDGDDDYVNFVAGAETDLPYSYFTRPLDSTELVPFDRTTVDIAGNLAVISRLCERTRDLRLLTLRGRFLILDNDIAGFAEAIEAMASLLETNWDSVHPRLAEGSMRLRSAAIGGLDVPSVIMCLQYLPLCVTARGANIAYRSSLYASGLATPRKDEAVPSRDALLKELRAEIDQVNASRGYLDRVSGAIRRIRTAWARQGDLSEAPTLKNLAEVVQGMLALLGEAVPTARAPAVGALGPEAEDAAAGQAQTPGAGQGAGSAIASMGEAAALLRAAARFFHAHEPSSPLLPLLAQSERLIGRSFLDVMQELLPDHVAAVTFPIGGAEYFALPMARLPVMTATDGAPTGESAQDQDDMAADAPAAAKLATRAEALWALEQVAGYLRRMEPSSPVPWLIERARALAERDFISLLRTLLPEAALRKLKAEN